MKYWEPYHIIVFMLAFTLCATFLIIIIGIQIRGIELEAERAKVMAGIIDGFQAIILLYLGAMLQKHVDKNRNG